MTKKTISKSFNNAAPDFLQQLLHARHMLERSQILPERLTSLAALDIT